MILRLCLSLLCACALVLGSNDGQAQQQKRKRPPLPRVAPWRLNLGLDASRGPWSARIEVDHSARQGRVPDTDTPTDSYTLVNLSLSQRFSLDAADAIWFVKLTNLGDELAYSASSIQTIRGLSPLPGRALKVGMRVTF